MAKIENWLYKEHVASIQLIKGGIDNDFKFHKEKIYKSWFKKTIEPAYWTYRNEDMQIIDFNKYPNACDYCLGLHCYKNDYWVDENNNFMKYYKIIILMSDGEKHTLLFKIERDFNDKLQEIKSIVGNPDITTRK